ncbi:MAG: DUF1080 domain-containing protein [Candidatus Poribacteria bacterium]|nr:DUF1080 domain-containing protein [Candidatus Poribacteria bacterium]
MRYSNAVSIILMVVILNSIALAGTWEENFNNGLPDGWEEISGEWKIEDDAYAETSGESVYAKTMFGDDGWTDYTVEVDVTLVKSVKANAAGVLIRADAKGDNGMRFWIRADQHKCQVSRWKKNKFEHIATALPAEPKIGKTHRLKIVGEGQNYQFFVDDKLMFEGEDDTKFRDNGRIGFIAIEALVQYDNLVIDGAEIPSAAVEPHTKLATRWGQLKQTFGLSR